MKRNSMLVICAALSLLAGVHFFRSDAAAPTAFQRYEHATIRWKGEDDTHLVRPNGQVEFLGALLRRVQRPDKTDSQAFFMNIALNAIAQEGFELVAMSSDEMVLRRPVAGADGPVSAR
jgi:hypothetical protein